jgi:hypothetical protein
VPLAVRRSFDRRFNRPAACQVPNYFLLIIPDLNIFNLLLGPATTSAGVRGYGIEEVPTWKIVQRSRASQERTVSQRSICNPRDGVRAKATAWTEVMPPSSTEPPKPPRDGSTTEIAGEGKANTFHVSSGVDPGPYGFDWPHD